MKRYRFREFADAFVDFAFGVILIALSIFLIVIALYVYSLFAAGGAS